MAVVWLLLVTCGHSAVVTNQTTTAGNWWAPGNWSQSHAPASGEVVRVLHNMLLTSSTPRLASCLVSNAQVTFSNWTTKLWVSNTLTLVQLSGKTNLTHAGPYTQGQPSNRVWVVCSNLLVQSLGMIDVSRRGYANTNGPGKGYGGSHFGYGGGYWTGGKYRAGNLYDTIATPSIAGSGGYDPYGLLGGHGGGVIRIEASGTVTVYGTIRANGQAGNERGQIHASAGSGGSIYINCRKLLGGSTAILQANGGWSGWAGWGGGGGGIAVDYNTTAQAGVNPGIRFETKGGMGGTYGERQWADFGTLYLSDASFLSTVMTNAQFSYVRFHAPGFTNWNPASLLIGNYTVLDFASNFTLSVAGNLRIDPYGQLGIRERSRLIAGGSILLPLRGKLFVRSGATNGLSRDYGTLVQAGGDITIGEESYLYAYADPTDGGGVLFRTRDLNVNAVGTFEAGGKGYTYDKGPGKGAVWGGAGHGGRGGNADSGQAGGPVNGLTNAPIRPGSGSAGTYGSEGGGYIRVEASRNVTLSGTIRANGWSPQDIHYGGGSGGGIFIQCRSFQGTASGAILANGGAGSYKGGGGGGGRIAVWYGKAVPASLYSALVSNLARPFVTYTNFRALTGFTGTNQASGGPGGHYVGTQPGYTGKVVVIHYDPPLAEITNSFATNVSTTAAWFRGYLTATGLPPRTVKVYWGTEDGGAPTSGLWQSTNTVAGSWGLGSYPSYNATGLSPATYYYYRFYVTNGAGADWSETTEIVLTSNVWVTAPDSAASEVGPDAGTFTIHRSNTNRGVRVYYSWAGTAQYGSDYTVNPAGTSLWFPPGVGTSNIVVMPQWDGWNEGSETVVLRLSDADVIRGTPSSNSVTIADASLTPGVNQTTAAGEWTNGACWSLGRMPIEDDVVTVKHAMTLRTNTFTMASCTITNTTLTFRNWNTALAADTVRVAKNGILTCLGPFTTAEMSNRVYVVCSNLTIDANGSIDVSKKGYSFSCGPGKGYGASYGMQKPGYSYGVAYGSASQPTDPGSGGIGYNGGVLGGYGGGAVRIQATGTVTVNGTISAAGQNGYERGDVNASSGSGGAVYITCRRIEGTATGLIQVNGGNAGWTGWAGGGGRIAVTYDTGAQAGYCPPVRFQAAGGTHSTRRMCAYDGTIYFPDRSMLSENMTGGHFGGGRILISGMTNWAIDHLTVTNCDVVFGMQPFTLTVTNDILVRTSGELTFLGAQVTCRNLILTNGGDMVVYSAPTNAAGPDYGASVTASGTIYVGPGSWVYPISDYTNGGSPLFTVGRLTVKSTGGFDATGYGYGQKKGPGMGNGAGHGGLGGSGTGGPGPTYDPTNMPVRPGSGARNYTAGADGGGEGGGAIRIQTPGRMTLDGQLVANGETGWTTHGGGGSGGTIFVNAYEFLGTTGAMDARGGGGNNSGGAGGGGGRVAIWTGSPPQSYWPTIRTGGRDSCITYTNAWPSYAGALSVTNGTGAAGNGQVGTYKYIWYRPPRGAIFCLR